MRFSTRLGGLAVALAVLMTAASGHAAPKKNFFPETAREAQGGRSVHVVVAQEELKADINKSNLAVAAGGGLLMALIDASVEAERAKKAEAAIQPLRAALQGYDADALATETTKAVAEQVTWLAPSASTFSRDSSVPGLTKVVAAGPANQVAVFTYAYDAAPDFSSMRVSLLLSVWNKAVPTEKTSDTRLSAKQLVFTQNMVAVVSLPSPAADAAGNIALWSADNGALARKGLAAAFRDVGSLATRALALTEADLKAMNGRDKKYVTLGGFGGRLQEQDATGSLMYTGIQLVHAGNLTP